MYNYLQIILFVLCLNCCTYKEERTIFQTTRKISSTEVFDSGNIFSLSPNRKYISRATQMGSVIEGYEVSCDSIIQKFSIQYDCTEKDNMKYGYISTCISNDKIFGLYSGNKISTESTAFTSKEIHVFDLKGNPIECLQIETPLCAIEWCEPLQSIYGISNIPEMHIVKLEE